MKIYTKTGDKGKTGLIGGSRVDKFDLRLEAYGTIDELNSFIGLLASNDATNDIREQLESIQNALFVVGSSLATDTSKTEQKKASILNSDLIELLEKEIDRMNELLTPLNYFILPGGSVAASYSHICRTIARRAERRICEVKHHYAVEENICIYINRLSDYFFVLSRYINIKTNAKEIAWKKVD